MADLQTIDNRLSKVERKAVTNKDKEDVYKRQVQLYPHMQTKKMKRFLPYY